MNKGIGSKQTQLHNDWFDQEKVRIKQLINYNRVNRQRIQKRIQKVLEKRNLWPSRKLNLECLKPKYYNCHVAVEYKIRIKEHK